MNTDQASVLHRGAIMAAATAVVPSFPTRTSWGQAWSGLPTPTAAHGSRSCGRTRLVSSVSLCVHRRASPTSTCLSVWRFHSAGRDLPCPRPNEWEGVDLPDILGTDSRQAPLPFRTLAQRKRTPRWFSDLSVNGPTFICGNKMPTRCNSGFYCRSYCLLNMFRASPCPSSGAQEYYTVVAACGILCCGFSSSWSGVKLGVMRPVCRMLVCWLILLSSWWWAWWCPKHVEQAIRSAIKTSVASSWHFISTQFL